MVTLWVFGDNSSSIFGETIERRYLHYKNYRKGTFPKSWSELLSEKLKVKLRNLAISGQTNYDIFDWFCKYCQNIKKNDIVIIGWSPIINFRLIDDYQKKFVSIRDTATNWNTNRKEFLKGISTQTIEEILNNRNQEDWIDEIYNWENLIYYISTIVGFKVYFWSFDVRLNKKNYIGGNTENFRNYLISIGAEDITNETSKTLIDSHFGEKGQLIQSEYFYNHIKNENTNIHNT
jgi:hypothetical protein